MVIVDGSAVVRARLAERFGGGPWVVVHCADMSEAHAAAAATEPDAVLLDVHLGPGAGVGGLARLRGALPEALIVVLTNEANDVYRAECLRHGADAVLDKAHDFDRAVELVLGVTTPT